MSEKKNTILSILALVCAVAALAVSLLDAFRPGQAQSQTPTAQVEEKLTRGHVILDIEPVGAFNVRKVRPDAVLIFIAPPSMEELERRLRNRGDTGEEQIRQRTDRAHWEMEQSKKYDHIVINDCVDTCADAILNIIAETAD